MILMKLKLHKLFQFDLILDYLDKLSLTLAIINRLIKLAQATFSIRTNNFFRITRSILPIYVKLCLSR